MSTNYTPQTWTDGSGGGTPLSAARMTYIETGIAAVDTAAVSGLAGKAAASHAAQHASAGSDPITIAESQVTGLVADLAAKAPLTKAVTAVAGTSYTLVLGDNGGIVDVAGNSATVTVPTNASVAFPVGTVIDIVQTGTGNLTVAPAGGVTVNYYSPSSAVTRQLKAQYAAATLYKKASDTWVLIGNLI